MLGDSDTEFVLAIHSISVRVWQLSVIFGEETILIQFRNGICLSNIHDPISRIVVLGYPMFPLLEVGRNIIDQTLIHDTALVHQDEAIKRIENFRRRLMNSANRAQLKIVELVFQDFGQQEGTTTTCVCLREQY
jgi:hypothetical protein